METDPLALVHSQQHSSAHFSTHRTQMKWNSRVFNCKPGTNAFLELKCLLRPQQSTQLQASHGVIGRRLFICVLAKNLFEFTVPALTSRTKWPDKGRRDCAFFWCARSARFNEDTRRTTALDDWMRIAREPEGEKAGSKKWNQKLFVFI